MTATSATCAACLIASLATGCSADCHDAETQCDGNRIMGCAPPGDVSGGRDFRELGPSCGSARCIDITVNGSRQAVCSTSDRQDPLCTQDGSSCIDAVTRLECRFGYGWETDCVGTCVDPTMPPDAPWQFCSIEPSPNPICDTPNQTVCDVDAVVVCLDHYVFDRIPCANGCVTSRSGVGYCVEGKPCDGADQATCDHEASQIHGCIGGTTVAMTCTPSSDCDYVTTGAARCEPHLFDYEHVSWP